jgi:hypothetical protein
MKSPIPIFRRSWALLLGTLFPVALQAQSVIYGVIRTDSTRRPIAGAEVVIDSLKLVTRSRGDGSYRLEKLPAGTYPMLARAIGFTPLRFEVTIAGTDSVEIDFELVRSVQTLAPLKVDASVPRFQSATMRAFEERRKRGFGAFFDRAKLAQLEPGPATSTLRRLGGIRLIVSTYPTECPGLFAASGRGGQGVATCHNKPLPDACYLAVYVDGVQLWTPQQPDPPPNMEEYQLRDFQAIEVYRGASELPAEYQGTGNACGAVFFWSRTGEP